jgi:hypothetical protein
MKTDGKAWQEILDAIGKTSKSQLAMHWKTDLQDEAGGGGGGETKGEAKDAGKGNQPAKGGGVRSFLGADRMSVLLIVLAERTAWQEGRS